MRDSEDVNEYVQPWRVSTRTEGFCLLGRTVGPRASNREVIVCTYLETTRRKKRNESPCKRNKSLGVTKVLY
jgi:hypothetical protein